MAVPRDYEEKTKRLGRPRMYESPEEMQKLIDQYFKDCEAKDDPLTMSGLAYALGMDRTSLVNYGHRDEFFNTVKRARDRIIADYERRLLKSGTPTIGLIFALKNNAGWVDKQEIETTSRITLSVPDDVEDTGDNGDLES